MFQKDEILEKKKMKKLPITVTRLLNCYSVPLNVYLYSSCQIGTSQSRWTGRSKSLVAGLRANGQFTRSDLWGRSFPLKEMPNWKTGIKSGRFLCSPFIHLRNCRSLEILACSRLRDSGEKSFRWKEMRKTRGGWGETFFSPSLPPFPSRARLIFALLVLIRPHYTIWEPGTGYGNSDMCTISLRTS